MPVAFLCVKLDSFQRKSIAKLIPVASNDTIQFTVKLCGGSLIETIKPTATR